MAEQVCRLVSRWQEFAQDAPIAMPHYANLVVPTALHHPSLRPVSASIDEKVFGTYQDLLFILAVNPLLALTLHKHLRRQLVVKYLHQIGVVAAANPLADADPVVVNLAIIEAFGPGDGRGEPNLLVRWLLVDDVRVSIVEGHFDNSRLHGMLLVMFGKEAS